MPDTLLGGWVASHSRQGSNAGQWLHRLYGGTGAVDVVPHAAGIAGA